MFGELFLDEIMADTECLGAEAFVSSGSILSRLRSQCGVAPIQL